MPSAERAFGAGRRAVVERATLPVPPPTHASPAELRAARIVEELGRCGPGDEVAFAAGGRALGELGLAALEKGFPGLLWFDRHMPHQRPPSGRGVSPIASLLVARGADAVPIVSRLLGRSEADHRYYAALVAADLCQPELVPALADRVFDDDREVRDVALSALASMSGDPAVRTLCARLRAAASDASISDLDLHRAVLALTRLCDAEAVPLLVSLLDSLAPGVGDTARQALRSMTGHDLGPTSHDWRDWLARER